MDTALCLERIYPAARFGGATNENTREEYEQLRWEDPRPQPRWEQLLAKWSEVEAALAAQAARDDARRACAALDPLLTAAEHAKEWDKIVAAARVRMEEM